MTGPDWARMFASAERILALAPWKARTEEKLFALQPRAEGPVYFASVMGKCGMHHAIAYYEGEPGLGGFRATYRDNIPEYLSSEVLLLTSHLQLVFEPKSRLTATDQALLKRFGKAARGKRPVFRTHRAARVPWIPNAAEAADLAILMEQTLAVLERGDENVFRHYSEEEFFLLTPEGKPAVCRAADLPAHRHVLRATLPAGALQGLRATKRRFEAEITLMLAPISDVPEGEPPYLPFALLLADSESGQIAGLELIKTDQGVDAALARIPDTLTAMLRKAGRKPATLAARNPILLSALKSYSKAYGIAWEEDHFLAAADQALAVLRMFPGR